MAAPAAAQRSVIGNLCRHYHTEGRHTGRAQNAGISKQVIKQTRLDSRPEAVQIRGLPSLLREASLVDLVAREQPVICAMFGVHTAQRAVMRRATGVVNCWATWRRARAH